MNEANSETAQERTTTGLPGEIDDIADLRPAETVMDLQRLGSLQPFRLSFMRILVRQMVRDRWQIRCSQFELDDLGYGFAVYVLQAGTEIYSFVVFAVYLADGSRNDRVIADQWDLTMALVQGEVTDSQLQHLRVNVPLQEAGRMRPEMLVLSRANRSKRMFDNVVDSLATGLQPDMSRIKDVGYLCRTTAVYGSGKFGMADWSVVQRSCRSFARPFAAEMFTCFMLRHFSVEQVQHIASRRAPEAAVALNSDIRRYLGVGNATGLGMAPFLIKHPQLIARWMTVREVCLARVMARGKVTPEILSRLLAMIEKVIQHTWETHVKDPAQVTRNHQLMAELTNLSERLIGHQDFTDWQWLKVRLIERYSLDTIETMYALMIELYPHLVDDLEEYLGADEHLQLRPEIALSELKRTIESQYGWALSIDFRKPESQHVFWYRSEEKMEPRLGERYVESGADKELPVQVARSVKACHALILSDLLLHTDSDVVHFLLRHPDQISIVRRIQTMTPLIYGDIRANLADQDMQPMHLLRAKLSFFGVSKFDPKSRLWVRNTMFQGAPLISELDSGRDLDDWYFPVAPIG